MPIDPNIALQAQPIQAPDLLGSYMKAAQLKNLMAQGQQHDLQTQQLQQQMTDTNTIKDLAAKHTITDPTTGAQQFDEPGFINELQTKNPVAANSYKKSSAETQQEVIKMNGDQLDNTKKTLDMISNTYAGLLAKPGGATPQDVQQAFNGLVQQGVVPAQAAQAQLQQIPQDPAQIHGYLLSHAMQQMDASKRMELALGDIQDKTVNGQQIMFNVNKLTGQVTPIKTLGNVPESSAGKLETDIYNGIVPNDQAGAYRHEAQTNMATVIQNGVGGTSGFSPEALDNEADAYRKTHVLGNYGMGTAGTAAKKAVINRAAAMDKAEGVTTDYATTGASYKADQNSLTQMTKNRDQLVTFENTALANLNQFTDLASKMPDSGSAWANKPIRELASGAFGSEAQAAAKTALTVVRPEFAKINQGALNGVLSDSARKEVESAMPDDATYGQFLTAAKVLKQDAANRHQFFDQGIQDIKSRIGGGGNKLGGSQANPIPVSDEASFNAVPSGSYYKAKDGSIGRKP